MSQKKTMTDKQLLRILKDLKAAGMTKEDFRLMRTILPRGH